METITSGVHQVAAGYVNAFIIDGDEGVTLVDTLLPKKDGVIVTALGEIGRSIDDVTAIVLTHSHADHTGGAAALKRASGAAVYASTVDAAAIRGEIKAPPPPISDRIVPLKWIMGVMPGAEPVVVEHVVGEHIEGALPADLRAIDTPGHTPGHVSFLLDRDGGVLFVGDAGRASRKGEVTRGWFNRSTPTIDASLGHIAQFEFQMACFGHSSPLRSGAGAAFQRFAASVG